MTRKDFQLIADVVATIQDKATREAVAIKFTERLAATNSAFDKSRFYNAAMGGEKAGWKVRTVEA